MPNNTNATKYRIAVDWEHNAEEWWDALRLHGGGSFSQPIDELLANDEIVVDAEQKAQLLSHFRSLPGWESGMAHAPHPVTIAEVTE